MPIYEFKCRECELVFEVLKRSTRGDELPERCPGCGGEDTEKLYSSFAGRVPASGGGCPAPGGPSGGCGSSGFS